MKKIQISPSILSADFSQLGNEIKRLEESNADMIHVDVMDGHFVPNLTIGPPVIKTLRKWGVRIDESLFLGGMNKTEFLKSFEADIFFDDQQKNIKDASAKVTSAHVPFGIKNKN